MLTISNYIKSPDSGGKFVVIVSRDDPDFGVIVFSDFTRDFQHRDIVRRWEAGRKATVTASGLRMAGGGWWKLEGGLLVVYGQSAAYGRFDPAWLRARLQPGMVLNETRIDIR